MVLFNFSILIMGAFIPTLISLLVLKISASSQTFEFKKNEIVFAPPSIMTD